MTELSLEDIITEKVSDRVCKNIKFVNMEGATELVRSLIASVSPSLTINNKKLKASIKLDCVHEKLPLVLQHLTTNEPVFLTGPAGSGKTKIAEDCAKSLNKDFGMISVCAQTTKSDFLGYFDAMGKYVSTIFRQIYQNGGLFLIDEIDAGNPNVLAVLNGAIGGSQYAFPDAVISKHEDFIIITTANTLGKGSVEYVGRNQLDAATLDRFNFIHIDYDKNIELMLGATNKKALYTIWKIRDFVLEHQLKIIISTRSVIKILKLLEINISIKDAINSTLFKSLDSDASNDMFNKLGM